MRIEIADKSYVLEYTINSVCALEKDGIYLSDVANTSGFSGPRLWLWCGLLHHNKDLTLIGAGELMNEYLKVNSLDDLTKAISGAIEEAGFLGAQGKKKKN